MTLDVLFYDIETFPNCFTCSILQNQSWTIFEISSRKNDIRSILQYLGKTIKQQTYFVGYNNAAFDDVILNFILQNEQYFVEYNGLEISKILYEFAQFIIEFGKRKNKDFSQITYERKASLFKYKYSVPFKSIDLLEVIREGYSVKGLKLVGVNLKHPKLQDLPYKHYENVLEENIDKVIEYNKNDVEIPKKIFVAVQERIKLRQDLESVYNVNLISAADSTIAKVIFDSYYPNKPNKRLTMRPHIKMVDVVSDKIKFKTEKYNLFLQDLLRTEFYDEVTKGFGRNFQSDICVHTIAAGGIHGALKNTSFKKTETHELWDFDFGSFYPLLLITLGICPEHLDKEEFLKVVKLIVEDRLLAKSIVESKDDTYTQQQIREATIKAAGLKISANTIYGLLDSLTYFLKDKLAQLKVTINGQLYLLMLIETLELNGFTVFYSNTDGISAIVPIDRKNIYMEIVKQFSVYTGISYELMEIEQVYYKDVNNYLLIKAGDKPIEKRVKVKGEAFVPQNGILKGFNKPISAIAVQNYLLYGTPIEDTVKNHLDIYDFCTAIKIDDSYTNYIQEVEKTILTHSPKTGKQYKTPKSQVNVISEQVQQASVRFFVSNYEHISDNTYKGTHLVKRRFITVDQEWLDKKTKSVSDDTKLKKKLDTLPKIGEVVMEQNSHCADQSVVLFNDYFEKPMTEYNINYEYYIEDAKSIVQAIKPFEIC